MNLKENILIVNSGRVSDSVTKATFQTRQTKVYGWKNYWPSVKK